MSDVQVLKRVVNRKALVRACARAAQSGVARGGIYDVRGSALVIWPGPWPTLPLEQRGEPLGMVSWEWGVPAEPFATITRVEAAAGVPTADVLAHLDRLLGPGGN